MVKDLGEKIRPHLLRIWSEIKKFGEDLGKIAVDKIGEFVESKYNPARPLKVIEGDFISGDSPLARELNKPRDKEVKVTQAEENTRKLRTADYYQKLLKEDIPAIEAKRQKIKETIKWSKEEGIEEGIKSLKEELKKTPDTYEILKEEVKNNPDHIDYNIFTPANRGKDKNPLVRGAYQLLFDKREQFKKEYENFLRDNNKLIRQARHSRGFKLIREDTQVIDYLEGKRKFQDLTPAEQKLAVKLKEWFKKPNQ